VNCSCLILLLLFLDCLIALHRTSISGYLPHDLCAICSPCLDAQFVYANAGCDLIINSLGLISSDVSSLLACLLIIKVQYIICRELA
jgi:hypothetical protein